MDRPSKLRRTALATALALAGAALVAPAAGAAYPFGSFVGAGDDDYTPHAEAVDTVHLCYIDTDGSDIYGAGEPLLLRFADACDRAAYDDRCLVCLDDKAPGSEIGTSDPEYDRFLSAIPDHNLTYVDVAGEGGIDPANPMYVDLQNVPGERVDPGDLRLTAWNGFEPLSVVDAGDPDVAASVDHVTGNPTEVGDEDTLYEAGEGLYLNTGGGTVGEDVRVVHEDHVRLNAEVPDRAREAAEGLAPAEPQGTPNATVVGIEATPEPVTAGAPLFLTLTVENRGSAAGVALVRTHLDGRLVDARAAPALDPGAKTTLAATLPAPAEPGIVNVTAGMAAATVTVEAAPAEDAPSTEASSDPVSTSATHDDAPLDPAPAEPAQTTASPSTVPASGAIAALVALAAIALFRRA